jgi:hypothetical protein
MSLAQLLEKVRDQTLTSRHDRPVVSIEDFFTGNEDQASIGRDLEKHPGIDVFRDRLLALRARKDVQAVLIAITEDMGNDKWPFTDTVYVLTSATEDEIFAFVVDLSPDAVEEHDPDTLPFALARLPMPEAWYRVLTIWWD